MSSAHAADTVFVGASALGLAIPQAAAAQTGANVLVVINHARFHQRHDWPSVRSGVASPNTICASCSSRSTSRSLASSTTRKSNSPSGPASRTGNRIDPEHRTDEGVPIRIVGYQRAIGHQRERGFRADAALPPPDRRVGSSGRLRYRTPTSRCDAFDDAEPFTHRAHDIYLVTRLDGYNFRMRSR